MFFPSPLPVRNSNRYALVIAGTTTPLTNLTLADALAITESVVYFEVIEVQHSPADFAQQPAGAGEQ
jgi:hypothetical protein